MRPTTSIMLQQNNNNNYPCLNMSASAADVLQKCSRGSLPFPSRMELGLGDLPLIRGLRAWTLCSKNRLKAGGLLKGGQAPTPAPRGHKGSQGSCTRPANVYLSGEWGHMAYGVPVEADRKAGIKALVTVATLKTSEGSGKTQTHCLFLQTEKGSCLYSTAKPVSVASSSATSSLVGEWLKGKTGVRGSSRDGPARRKEQGLATVAQSTSSRVRVRSGRRWRKSSNLIGRDGQRSGGKGPAGEEMTLDERQEEPNKDGSDRKQPPSPGQDIRRARSEKQAAFRSLRCCHSASPKTCAQCRRGGSPGAEHPGGVPTRPNSEAEVVRQKNREEEHEVEEGCLCDSSDSAASNSDFKHHNHPPSFSHFDIGEIREAASSDERNSRSPNKDDYSVKEEDGESEWVKKHTSHYSQRAPPGQDGDRGFMLKPDARDSDDQMQREAPRQETAAHVNALTDVVAEAEMEELKEEEGGIKRLMVEPDGYKEPSPPDGGSNCNSDVSAALVDLEGSAVSQQGAAESGSLEKEELKVYDVTVIQGGEALLFPQCVLEDAQAAPICPEDPCSSTPSTFPSTCTTTELEFQALGQDELTRAEESQERIPELGVNPKDGDDAEEIRQSRRTCNDGKVDYNGELHTSAEEKEVEDDSVLEDKPRLEEASAGSTGSRREDGDARRRVGAKGGVSSEGAKVASATPCPCPALLVANPAPSAHLQEATTSAPPCMEEEGEKEEGEEKEKERQRKTVVRESKGAEERRKEGELEEKRSTVATEEGSREQQEEEEEDEFGVFMQADGEPAWSDGSTTPASVPCEIPASTGECLLFSAFCSPFYSFTPPSAHVTLVRRRKNVVTVGAKHPSS